MKTVAAWAVLAVGIALLFAGATAWAFICIIGWLALLANHKEGP